jgi:hypothetical protein
MHDYLATDGETSYRSRGEEADARRQLYSGRDKTKVEDLYGSLYVTVADERCTAENVQVI